MERTTEEICKNKLVGLGEAMVLFLNGKQMTSEQLMLIKEATDKQKVLSLMIRSATMLKGQEYTNYCCNARILSRK